MSVKSTAKRIAKKVGDAFNFDGLEWDNTQQKFVDAKTARKNNRADMERIRRDRLRNPRYNLED